MADTRCANPEYQLDVDTMAIEYLLHKAIESSLEVLALQVNGLTSGGQNQSPNQVTKEKQAECIKWRQDLDTSIKVFHRNHPTASFSRGVTYNRSLLRFLFVLCLYIPRGTRIHLDEKNEWQDPSVIANLRQAYCDTNDLPSDYIQKSQDKRVLLTTLRRNWLNLRYGFEGRPANTANGANDDTGPRKRQKFGRDGTTTDESIVSSDRNSRLNLEAPVDLLEQASRRRRHPPAPANLIVHQDTKQFAVTLFELIPFFMQLTVDISRALGDVNSQWVDLATEFMLQSGIERLQEISGGLNLAEREDKNTKPFTDYLWTLSHGLPVWIEECFAWGSVKKPSSVVAASLKVECAWHQTDIATETLHACLEMEDLVSAMFNSSIDTRLPDETISTILDNTSADEAHKQESTRYTELRGRYLRKLATITIADAADGNEHYVSAVKELCKDHPIKPFLIDLHHFLRQLWLYNINEDVSGKPVLVQIEEGGLEGLNDEEFGVFLKRVGLKRGGASADQGGAQIRWDH